MKVKLRPKVKKMKNRNSSFFHFFYFWISKNLFLKGQSPASNQEQYKKPKLPERRDTPLKGQHHETRIVINPTRAGHAPPESQSKRKETSKTFPPRRRGRQQSLHKDPKNIDPTYRANKQPTKNQAHTPGKREINNPPTTRAKATKYHKITTHSHGIGTKQTNGNPWGTPHPQPGHKQPIREYANLHDKETQGDILKAKLSHS